MVMEQLFLVRACNQLHRKSEDLRDRPFSRRLLVQVWTWTDGRADDGGGDGLWWASVSLCSV